MTTTQPTQSPTFTPEQRRMLGQVYNLILSWPKSVHITGHIGTVDRG